MLNSVVVDGEDFFGIRGVNYGNGYGSKEENGPNQWLRGVGASR